MMVMKLYIMQQINLSINMESSWNMGRNLPYPYVNNSN